MPRTKRSERIARALKQRDNEQAAMWARYEALAKSPPIGFPDLPDERDLERDDNAHEPTGGW